MVSSWYPDKYVLAVGIASGEALGHPVIIGAGRAVALIGIASAEAFGSVKVINRQIIHANGIPSAEAFGSTSVKYGQVIRPMGIATNETFGLVDILDGSKISLIEIASAEAFGIPTISGKAHILPTGIASAEAFGVPNISGVNHVLPTGIASAEAFGSATVLRDANYSNVVALLHCDGTNGSTTFIDSSPLAANWVPVGTVQISTAQSKFGGSSLSAPGTSDFIKPPATTASSSFAFGTGDFTIEMWIYMVGTEANNQVLYDGRGGGTLVPLIFLNPAATSLSYALGATTEITASVSVIGGFHHVAVCRSGTSTKMFLDGTQIGSTFTDANNYTNTTSNPVIGNASTGGRPFNGYMDEIRITKGFARYTANFTPSTTPF